MSQPPLVSGMVLGGALISAIGAGSTIFVEEKRPSVKSLSRDFIIGATMVALIMQILPESSSSTIEFLLGLVPLTLFSAGGAGTQKGGDGGATADEDLEVKVGVPRF
jgi:hypothetical protein